MKTKTCSSAAVRRDDAQTAARKLGVANILTGNVRQTASAIRVTAELIDGQTGMSKWSQNYDRAPGDVIRIQTEIAENVTRALFPFAAGCAAVYLRTVSTSAVAVDRTSGTAVINPSEESWSATARSQSVNF